MNVMRIASAVLVLMSATGAGAGRQNHPVYPAGEKRPSFSHQRHEHAACEQCHAQTDRNGKRSTRCQPCHAGTEISGRLRLGPTARLKFNHRLHEDTPESCVTCHLTEQEDGPIGLLPLAARCTPCHDQAMRNRCDACHPAGADGKLIIRWSMDKLSPRGGHGGDDHGAGWERSHGRGGRRPACFRCHQQRHCDACHRGVIRPMRWHPADWELSHPGPARAGLMKCDSCHRSQYSCLACHRQTGVAESAPKRPQNMRLHPPGYRDRHGRDARRNLKACTACHRESDCIRCHGASGIGLGVRPHPPGFRQRCRLLQGRNRAPCLKCHPAAELELRCP